VDVLHGSRLANGAALAAMLAATGVAAIGCHSGGTTSASSRLTARPTSTAAVTGEQDAKKLLAHCIPASTLTQLQLAEPKKGKPAREKVMECMGVPKPDRGATAACALGNIEAIAKLPKAKRPKGRQAVSVALLDAAYPCVQKYQGAK
jgi:poly(3-hydroxybutyrate) depolymerase